MIKIDILKQILHILSKIGFFFNVGFCCYFLIMIVLTTIVLVINEIKERKRRKIESEKNRE